MTTDPRRLLRDLMDARELNPTSLARALVQTGRTDTNLQSHLSRWLRNPAADLAPTTARPVAEFFRINPGALFDARAAAAEHARLFGASGAPPGVSEPAPGGDVTAARLGRPVPLISWVTAGRLADVEDNHLPGRADEWIAPARSRPGPRAFALTVVGDSMDGPGPGPSFPEGTVLIVDPDQAPTPGRYVIAKDVGTQGATFKRLMSDGARWYLRPLNPAYPTVEIDSPAIRVVGVVVEAQTIIRL